jgi:hypothetical protein
VLRVIERDAEKSEGGKSRTAGTDMEALYSGNLLTS